jgi:hypothetical protein
MSNSAYGGEVGDETIFRYRQNGDLAWADYSGGDICFGTLIAKVLPDGSLDVRYQHLNAAGELMTGVCSSTPEILPDGRIRLHEKWRWTTGDLSNGESIIEQIPISCFEWVHVVAWSDLLPR